MTTLCRVSNSFKVKKNSNNNYDKINKIVAFLKWINSPKKEKRKKM